MIFHSTSNKSKLGIRFCKKPPHFLQIDANWSFSVWQTEQMIIEYASHQDINLQRIYEDCATEAMFFWQVKRIFNLLNRFLQNLE